jgi:hypothetical protein
MAEKCPQEVHPGKPLLPHLLKVLTQVLQLVEILPSHSISHMQTAPRGAHLSGSAQLAHACSPRATSLRRQLLPDEPQLPPFLR